MINYPLYLSVLFTQVYSLSGANITVEVTSFETSLYLRWNATDIDANYTVKYGVYNSLSDKLSLSVAMPPDGQDYFDHRISDLDPGQLYDVEIEENSTTIFLKFIATKPLPVENVLAGSISSTTIDISWSPQSDSFQESYQVLVTGITSPDYVFESLNISETGYQLSGLQPGHNYTITVLAISRGEISNQSAPIYVNTAPLPPDNLSVVAIDTEKLNVSWSPASGSLQDKYIISYTYNASEAGVVNERMVNTTCLDVWCVLTVGGTPGQIFEITVYSVQGNAYSDPEVTLHSTKPSPINSLEEVLSNVTTIHIKWTIPELGTMYVRSFTLMVNSKYGSNRYDVDGKDRELAITNLDLGYQYTVTVYVLTAYELSKPYEKVFYTYPLQVISVTSDPRTDVTNTSITVQWSINKTATYDHFTINISPLPAGAVAGSFPLTLSSDTLYYNFTGLTPGQSYRVSVITDLSFKKSNPVSATFRTLPNSPQNLNVTAVSSSEVQVKWESPVSGIIDGYQLTLTLVASGDRKLVNVTGTQYTFIGLLSGSLYKVEVQSRAGELLSHAQQQNVTTNPLGVSGLTVAYRDSHTVNVSWLATRNTSFDYYTIAIEPPVAGSPVNLNRSTSPLMYSFVDLDPGTLYKISINTVLLPDIKGEASTINVITSPLPVMYLHVEPFKTGLLAKWNVDNSSSQSGFSIWYSENLNVVEPRYLDPVPFSTDQYSYSAEILDLYPGGTYKVKVQAWQNMTTEMASSSSEETFGTAKPLPVVSLESFLKGQDSIVVDWEPPMESSFQSYHIRYRPTLRDPDTVWLENSTFRTNITLGYLFPGEQYEIEVYTVSQGVWSEVRKLYQVVAPLGPSIVDILANRTTTTEITLQWLHQPNTSFVESWLITYFDNTGSIQEQSVPISSGTIVEVKVQNLVAGYQYSMSVKAVVKDVKSLPTAATGLAYTKPLNNVVPSFWRVPTRSSFTFDYSFEVADKFDTITFTIAGGVKVTKYKNEPNTQVEFTGLGAGALYIVEIQTVSGPEKSEVKTFTAQTLPNKPTVTSQSTAYSVSLTVFRPVGGVERYQIFCTGPLNSLVSNHSTDSVLEVFIAKIDDLKPHTVYTCHVAAVFQMYNNTATLDVLTQQTAPSVVRDVRLTETAPNEANLTWEKPEFLNGEITVYMISYQGKKENDQVEGKQNISYPATSHVFSNLKAGFTYIFNIRAVTIAAGMPAFSTITLRTYKPVYKDGITVEKATPKMADQKVQPPGSTHLYVNFTNAFSDKYGEIVQYTVIVTEDKNASEIKSNPYLPSWTAARNDPHLKAYQAIANCSTFFAVGVSCDINIQRRRAISEEPFKVFMVGSDKACTTQYCNGPLKPDTTYYVALRAYTSMQYSDTPFSAAVRTAPTPTEDETNVGAIVGAVVGAVAVLVIIVVVVVVLRRRMAQKSNMYRHEPGEQLTARSSLSHRKSYNPVHLTKFREHILQMRADSDFRYAEQFEDLKEVGRGQPQTAAELASNRGKNRFTNILPYDHSRVKLLPIDDEEGSDYINASYIPGYSSKREYIVTQGPLPATRDEFWRMVWEQNARNIVMLTKCIENGREKCDRYWPNGSDAVFYGDLQVAALNETLFPDWTITEFKVSLGDQSRQIRHFHFTSWPDFGVPKKEQILVRFIRMVREKLIKDGGPIVVHCSAGVGRSGTYVVLDRLLQHIRTHESVDVYNTVAELRKERVWMVQTEQQYICIHNCLLCVLEGNEDLQSYGGGNEGHSNVAFEDDEGVDLN